MRALWLDFQRAEPGRRLAGTGLLVAGLLVSGLLLADYVSVVAETDELEHEVSRLRKEADQARRMAGEDGALLTHGGKRQVADDQASSGHEVAQWESLFNSLESAADESVTLLALNTGTTEIQISGEAKNIAAAMDYVKRLQPATVFSNPHLTQSEVVQEHPQHPVRFALAASWKESGRERGQEGGP
jgi:Tfp pilus assembly protein PilN